MKLRQPMLLILIYCLRFGGAAHGGTLTHGGDGIITLFEEARHSSVKLLNTLVDVNSFADDTPMNIRKYVLENKAEMIEDIQSTLHVWKEENTSQEKCALTETNPKAQIQFSLEKCRQTSYNLHNSMQVIIHETIHHLGIADELFCDQLAMYLTLLNDPSFKTVGVWQEVTTSPCNNTKGVVWPYVNQMSYGDGKLFQLKMSKNDDGTIVEECSAIYDLKKKVWEKTPLPPISIANFCHIIARSLPLFYKGKVVFHLEEMKNVDNGVKELQTILTYDIESKKWTRVVAPKVFQAGAGSPNQMPPRDLKMVGLGDKVYFFNTSPFYRANQQFFVSYSLTDNSFEVLDIPKNIDCWPMQCSSSSLMVKDNKIKLLAPNENNRDLLLFDYDVEKNSWIKNDFSLPLRGAGLTVPFQLSNDFLVEDSYQNDFSHFNSSTTTVNELPKVFTRINAWSAEMSPDDKNLLVLGKTGDFGVGLVYNFKKNKWFSLSNKHFPGENPVYLGSFEGQMIYFNYGPSFYIFDTIL